MSSIIEITNLQELPSIAQKIIQLFDGKKIVAFNGEMGAGKTTLIKAICEAMGVAETVSSPTFSIVNEYVTAKGQKIYHFDFYRIKSEEEAFDMGYEEYFYTNAICFIEWPQKIQNILPPETIHLTIAIKEGKRIISIQ